MIQGDSDYEQKIDKLLGEVNSSNYLKTGYQLGRILSKMTSDSTLDTEGCKKIVKNVHALLRKIEAFKESDCDRKVMSKVQSIVNTIRYRSVKSRIDLVNKRLASLVDVALKNEEKSRVIDKKSNSPSVNNENIQKENTIFIQSLLEYDEPRLVRELLMLSPNQYGQLKIWLEKQPKDVQNKLSKACKEADILIQKARGKRVARRKTELLSQILYKPTVSEEKKQEIRAKFRNVFEKIKVIGKGSLNKNAKILDPAYWVETLTFGNEKFHVYQNFLAPYKKEWDSKKK